MKNILHRHKYKIIGTAHFNDKIEVDLVCKCGKSGTVGVEKCFETQVLQQAAKGEYFNVPRIMY